MTLRGAKRSAAQLGGLEYVDAPARSPGMRLAGRRGSIIIVVVLTAAQWLCTLVPTLIILIPLIWVGGLLALVIRRRPIPWIVFLLGSPISLSFMRGVSAWSQGRAYMMGIGPQDSTRGRLHPITRAPQTSSGCVIYADTWLKQDPYNLGVTTMSRLFGPQKGSYDGPIPTESEMRAQLAADSVSLHWKELRTDTVHVGGETVQLDKWLGPALVDACYGFDPIDEEPSRYEETDYGGLMRAALWKERVLLISLSSDEPNWFDEPDDRKPQLVAIDTHRGLPIALYQGNTQCDGMPLVWRSVGPRLLDMDFATDPPPLFATP